MVMAMVVEDVVDAFVAAQPLKLRISTSTPFLFTITVTIPRRARGTTDTAE